MSERVARLAADLICHNEDHAAAPSEELQSSALLSSTSTSNLDWALAVQRPLRGDTYARIIETVSDALDFKYGALLVAETSPPRHSLTAYRQLPPAMLQLIAAQTQGWLGLERQMKTMTPAVLRPTGNDSALWRTAMALFNLPMMVAIPFHEGADRLALLLLWSVQDPTGGEQAKEASLSSLLYQVQVQLQLVTDRFELERRVDQSTQRMLAIRAGLRHLTSTNRPQQIWQKTCQQLQRIFSCTVVWLGLLEEGHVRPVAVNGASDVLLRSLALEHRHPLRQMIEEARQNRCLVKHKTHAQTLLQDTVLAEMAHDRHAPLRRLVDPDALLRTMVAPIIGEGEVLGVLVLHKDRDFALDEDDWDVLWVFADHAALAIQSGRLLEEGQEREAKLVANEGLYRSFVNQLSDGLVRLDLDGNLVELSASAARLFGVVQADALGKPLVAMCDESSVEPIGHAVHLAIQGEAKAVAMRVRRPDNERTAAVARLGPLRVGEQIVGVIGVIRDDTERLSMQSKLLVREKLASVGMLSAGVAHEVNNPLAFVASNLMTLIEDFQAELRGERRFDNEERLEMLQECSEGAQRIQDIVGNLKRFSQRTENEELVSTDLNSLIASTAWLVSPEAHYSGQIVLQLAEDLPKIHCRPGGISQLLVQLLLNAVQALPEREGPEHEGIIKVSTWNDGLYVIMDIDDNGAGIPRDVLTRITRPFYTTRPPGQGTGLGLVMCVEVIQQHGGRLTVSSEVGKGTRVRVRLPRNPDDHMSPLEPALRFEYAGQPVIPPPLTRQ